MQFRRRQGPFFRPRDPALFVSAQAEQGWEEPEWLWHRRCQACRGFGAPPAPFLQSRWGLALGCCWCQGRPRGAARPGRWWSGCCSRRWRCRYGVACRSAPCRGQCRRRNPLLSSHSGARSDNALWQTVCPQGTILHPQRLPGTSSEHRSWCLLQGLLSGSAPGRQESPTRRSWCCRSVSQSPPR